MTIFSWILLVGILSGAALVVYILNTDKDNATYCCGCGQCAISGECVLTKKKVKNAPAHLTNKG